MQSLQGALTIKQKQETQEDNITESTLSSQAKHKEASSELKESRAENVKDTKQKVLSYVD